MALKAGDLYVLLSARTAAFGKGLTSAAKSVELFASKVKKIGKDLGQLGAGMAAIGAAAVAIAAKHNREVAAEVAKQKKVFATLANEIAVAMLPALRALGDVLVKLLGWWQNMNPETKAAVIRFAEIAATVLLAAGVIGKLAGLVSALAGIFGLVGTVISSGVLIPLALVTAAVLALITVVGLLKRAWEGEFGGEIAKNLRIVAEIARTSAEGIAIAFTGAFQMTITAVKFMARQVLSHFGVILDVIGKAADAIPGMGAVASGARSARSAVFAAQKLFEPGEAAKAAKAFGTEMVDSFKAGADLIKDGIGAAMKAMGLDFKGGGKGKIMDSGAAAELGHIIRMGNPLQAPGAVLSARAGGTGSRINQLAAPSGTRARSPKLTMQITEAAQTFGAMIKGSVLAAAPKLNSAIDAAMEGAAFGAGGAVVGAVIGLATQSENFARTMEAVEAVVQLAADTVGMLIGPFLPFIGAVFDVATVLLGALAPAFAFLGAVLEPFIPIVELLATVFSIFAPAIQIIALAFVAISNPLTFLANVILPVLFSAIKMVALTVMKIVRELSPVWNALVAAISGVWKGIVGAVQGILNALGGIKIKIFDIEISPFAFMSTWAAGLESSKTALDGLSISASGLDQSIKDLNDLTFESAKAKAEETAATISQTKAARDATEELTNVPMGFKVAAMRRRAQDAAGMAEGIGGGDFWKAAAAGTTINVYGNVYGVDSLVDEIDKAQANKQFRKTGRFGSGGMR